MSKRPQQSRLILPDDLDHGVDRARFDKMLPEAGLAKLKALFAPALVEEPENRQAISGALCNLCWRYYKACLPEAKSRRSRAARKKEAARAARQAERLAVSVDRLWRSEDTAVRKVLGSLGEVWPPNDDGLPSAPLSPGFLRLLEQLGRKLALLASGLSDDVGGPRKTFAFDELVMALASMYVQLTKYCQLLRDFPQGTNDIFALIARGEPPGEPATASTREPFFRFVAGVVEILRAIERRLPAAAFDLPPNDGALRKRLARLAIKRPSIKVLKEEELLDLGKLLAEARSGHNPKA